MGQLVGGAAVGDVVRVAVGSEMAALDQLYQWIRKAKHLHSYFLRFEIFIYSEVDHHRHALTAICGRINNHCTYGWPPMQETEKLIIKLIMKMLFSYQ